VFALAGAAHAAYVLQIGAVSPRVLTFTVSVTGLLVLLYFTPRLEWLEVIAKCSFAIYLFHPFAIAPARKILQALALDSPPFLFTVCLIAGLIVPIAVEFAARRIPLAPTLLLGERHAPRRLAMTSL
jgi:hypothetical protein